MNYETFSNAELNQSLACLVYELDGWELSDSGGSFYHCGVDGGSTYAQPVPSYCTDWNATMPLAIEHGVELSPCYNGRWFAGVVESYTHEEEVLSYSGITNCNDPLRAIVICLIKKLDGEK